MKKIALVFALIAVVAAGSVFAQENHHPSGWAFGPGFQFGNSWSGGGDAGGSFTVFLKAPQWPIYWGINVDIFDAFDDPNSNFQLSLTGDYFIFDRALVDDIGLGWFLGAGGYFTFYNSSYDGPGFDDSYTAIDFGARMPLGFSWMPINWLEVFIDIAPSIGLRLSFPSEGDFDIDLGGGWQGDFGVRFWF